MYLAISFLDQSREKELFFRHRPLWLASSCERPQTAPGWEHQRAQRSISASAAFSLQHFFIRRRAHAFLNSGSEVAAAGFSHLGQMMGPKGRYLLRAAHQFAATRGADACARPTDPRVGFHHAPPVLESGARYRLQRVFSHSACHARRETINHFRKVRNWDFSTCVTTDE